MKRRGVTVIEGLVVAAIVIILLTLIYGAFSKKRGPPQLLSTNVAGQQTWRVPADSFPKFQQEHTEFKIISLSPITESTGEHAETTAYMIVLEMPKNPEKSDELQKEERP